MISIGFDDETAVSSALVAVARLGRLASQTAFRVLLDTLARPGVVVPVPDHVLADEVPPALLVPLALADLDIRLAVLGRQDALRWARVVAGATGGRPSVLDVADIVVAFDGLDRDDVLAVRRGRPESPEDAARIALACRRLSDGSGRADVVLELTGPGVPGTRTLGVDGLDAVVFAALAEANDSFPVGVDTWLLADDGGVVGLPRSTRIRIVEPSASAGTEED